MIGFELLPPRLHAETWQDLLNDSDYRGLRSPRDVAGLAKYPEVNSLEGRFH